MQPLRDTLSYRKRSSVFFKLVEKENVQIFWNGIYIKPLGETRIEINDKEYKVNPNMQEYFTNTSATTKLEKIIDKLKSYDILKIKFFYHDTC